MVRIARLKPRISLRVFLLLVAIAPLLLAWLIRSHFVAQPSMVPSDAEVVQAVINSGQRVPPTPHRIVKETIAEYSDPARNYPLIGLASLHHAHFKCSVFSRIIGSTPITVNVHKQDLRDATGTSVISPTKRGR